MNLRQKILIVSLSISILPLLVAMSLNVYLVSSESKQALNDLTKARLISTRDIKKTQIEGYFETINLQTLNLASAPFTLEALSAFRDGYANFAPQTGNFNLQLTKSKLSSYYQKDFTNRYLERNGDVDAPSTKSLMQGITLNGLALQVAFISENPNPLGDKDQLTDLVGSTDYGSAHTKFHPFFRDFQEKFGFYDIFLVDKNGNVVYSVFKEIDFATNLFEGPHRTSGLAKAFVQATALERRGEKAAITDFAAYLPSYDDVASFVSSPIFENGDFAGALVFQMPIDQINQIMTYAQQWPDVGLGASGESYIVGPNKTLRSESRFLVEDKRNYIEQLSQRGNEQKQIIANKNSVVGLQSVDSLSVNAALNGKSGYVFTHNYLGHEVLSAYTPLSVGNMDWAVISEIAKNEAFSASDNLNKMMWLTGLVLIVIFAVVNTLAARRFSGYLSAPMIEISSFLKELTVKLNLAERINIKSKDEIGEAANDLNEFLGRLQVTIKGVHTACLEIMDSTEKTITMSEKTNRVAENQQEQTSLIASAINEMSATISDVSKNLHYSNTLTQSASAETDNGMAMMRSTLYIMDQLQKQLFNTGKTIEVVDNSSNEIAEVLTVINTITEQTNLLALNASIEAARAGEHGRGFAVVASEVRELAMKTTESTAQISSVIERLQTNARLAVSDMESSNHKAIDTHDKANTTSAILKEIESLINQINDMSNQIAVAAEEQTAVANEIDRNIVSIDVMASETSEAAKEVSSANKDLYKLTEGLTTMVNEFRV